MSATFDQARHLLKVVAEKDLTKAQVTALHDSGLLTDLLEAARGNFANVDRMMFRHVLGLPPQADEQAPHVIDCDAYPFMPDGWSVEEHRKGGAFKWDPANVALCLTEKQKNGKWIEGNKLRKELVASKLVLNANVLDYLLAHPHLIPEEWRGKTVFFWGTVYRDRYADLHVRYLFWSGGRWCQKAHRLGDGWYGDCPAAVLAP